jgi:dimethylargininase
MWEAILPRISMKDPGERDDAESPAWLRHALVRSVSSSMDRGLTTQNLGRPDLSTARREHAEYVRVLRSLGVDVTVLESADDLPDSHFVEDTAVIHRGTAILTRPGAAERQAEVERIRPHLEKHLAVRELGGSPGARVDGGDVLVAGRQALIGIGARTNREGAERMADHLRSLDPQLTVHLVPFRGLLHFKSGITAVRPGCYVGDPRIQLEAGSKIGPVHWLPASEGYGANVLPLNGAVLVSSSSPAVRAIAETEVGKVVPLDMGEFRKMDGALTCLSLLW